MGSCMSSGNSHEVSSKLASKQNSLRKVSSTRINGSEASLSPEDLSISLAGSNLYIFTFAELQMATGGFSTSNFVGEGGFGPVYKGVIDERVRPGMESQSVAVKLLDLEGLIFAPENEDKGIKVFSLNYHWHFPFLFSEMREH